VEAVKIELYAFSLHYWIYISTVKINGVGSQDERGRHYKFTTMTALDSYYCPSATHLSMHPFFQNHIRGSPEQEASVL